MTQTYALDQETAAKLARLAQQLRVDSVRSSSAAGSGHPTSSLSAADLMAVLLARYLRYDFAHPDAPGNDHLIFSKGHASPLLYAMFKAAGAITDQDFAAIGRAYAQARVTLRQPRAIVARTRKGRGVSAVEDAEGWHGKPVPDANEAIRELGGLRDERVQVRHPEPGLRPHVFPSGELRLPEYQPGDKIATRTAFGHALAAVGTARSKVVVLDGEVADSTRTEFFAHAHPDRFFEFYIAEQQMVAAAVGMQVRGWAPFAT